MSRLAGLFSGRPVPVTGPVDSMLAAQTGHLNVRRVVETGPAGALGFAETQRADCMASVSGIGCVLDGHVYNRDELDPDSPGDASAIAASALRRGVVETLKLINGEFACAIYDGRRDVLWLARDRFGVKPLYYAAPGDAFAFASRPAGLLTLEGVPAEPDPAYVARFAVCHYRYIDNDPHASPYRAIRQVPPGSVVRWSPGNEAVIAVYGRIDPADDLPNSEADLAEWCRELLIDAVRIRLNRAGPKCVFSLSGGLDSSSVLSCAAHVLDLPQDAVSALYDDRTYDETDDIRPMLESKVGKWEQVRISAPDLETLIPELIGMHDEPVATATWLAHAEVCRAAAGAGYVSLFGGLGGDELNAGEYEYFPYFFADLICEGRNDLLDAETRKWAEYHDHPIYRKNHETMRAAVSAFTDRETPGRCLTDRSRLGRYHAALDPNFYPIRDFEPAMDHPFTSCLKNRAYQDLYRETAPCCLRSLDRIGSAFGIETFLPFFDRRLVSLMFRVPGTMKIRAGVTKHLLRRAMDGILPEATRTRIKKTGWNAPAHVWFAGGDRDFLMDILRSREFRERGVYCPAEVDRLVEEHRRIVRNGEPRDNHMMFFWQLVNLEMWLRSLDARRRAGRP